MVVGGALLFGLTVSVLLLPAGVVRGSQNVYVGWLGSHYDWGRYWEALRFHFGEILSGRLEIGPKVELSTLLGIGQVTGVLLASGAMLALVLGPVAGCLMSRYGPPWLRRATWAGSFLLLALPDLLMIVALQLLVRPVGIPVYGAILGQMTWRHYLLPVACLTLLTAPYLARVVAGAVDEVGEADYVVAARARGVPPWELFVRYIWRNALVRIWPALPAVAGILLSAAPVVEYMTELPGLGRQLVRLGSGYGAALALLPLLAVMTLLQSLISAGEGWVNPVQGALSPAKEGGRSHMGLRDLLSEGWQGLRDLAGWFGAAARALPGAPRRLGRALRRNPVLLAGGLLALLLLLAGLFAPHLSPHHWGAEEPVRIGDGILAVPPYPPGPQNPLGTDSLGRDMLSRVLWGTRFGLIIALLAVPMRFGLAVPLAFLAARRDGWFRRALRGAAAVFTSLPSFLLPLALVPGINNLYTGRPAEGALVNILLLSLPGVPRLAEALCLTFREMQSRPFVEGAVAAGAGGFRLLLRHMLPHAWPALAVLFALEVPVVMTTTAFLGLNQVFVGGTLWDPEKRRIIGANMPEWGAMMPSPFQLLVKGEWWLWAPLGALCLAVLAFTLLGEGLRRQMERPGGVSR